MYGFIKLLIGEIEHWKVYLYYKKAIYGHSSVQKHIFSVCGCRSVYCLHCRIWSWPSSYPSVASWPTTYAARTSWQLPLSGKSWTVEVRSLSQGQIFIFTPLSLQILGVTFMAVDPYLSVFLLFVAARWVFQTVSVYENLCVPCLHTSWFTNCDIDFISVTYVMGCRQCIMLNSIVTVVTKSLCVHVCDLLSGSVRIWHGGHIAAGCWIFPQQRSGHLLPGASSGLQWICYIRSVKHHYSHICTNSIQK